jgi:hypothetical protein
MPIFPDNFVANSLSGTILITDGHANLSLTTNPYALEGDKSFIIKLRKGGPSGLVIATSSPITLRDTSSIVSFTANISSVNEGNLVQFTLVTANAVDNSNVYYSVFPATANITRQDFFGANTGMATIVSNQATFALRANADLSLMDETGENFRVQLRTNSPVGNIIYSTSNVEILDVSKGFNILSFVENNSTVAEGGTLTLTFNATNIPVGTVFHYFTEGNATTSTFTGGNTGSFVMNGLSNTVTLLPTAVPYSTTQNFNVKLRALSNTSVVVATSNNIIAIDSALAYINATGGTITDSGGYRIHAFTTSGNLTISSLGIGSGNLTDYLVIAAGGGGGSHFGGGGGGAGGFLSSNTTISSIGNLLVTVGAGGGAYSRGSNSSIDIVVASGGGGGGGAGGPGGSGGGGTNFGDAYPGGLGTTGQGFPGGFTISTPSSVSKGGGGGGGASQAGEPGPVSLDRSGYGGNGSPSSWVTPSYGTTGPAPGRWFSGGGGSGAAGPPGTFGPGGAGGGGRGGVGTDGSPSPGIAGTIYTGGGGGGSGGPIAWGSVGGTGGSGIVIVRYPYVAPITISNVLVTPSAYIVGSNITFTINATNANLTTLYYTTDGNVDSSYFIGGNTGSFVANASGGIVTLLGNTNATVPVGETRNFRLQIRQDSTTGFISGSSSNVALLNSADYYVNATGGSNVFVSGGYKIHTFNTSSILNVTSIGGTGAIEYLVVAGGGAGGGYYGGGGGAGGVLTGSTTISSTGNITVVVGGGGATAYARGSNSSISVNQIVSSGGGGSQGPGGSGGGGSGGDDYAGGLGTTGQGFPGGNTTWSTPPTGSGGGGGAGQAGAPGGLVSGVGGRGGNGISVSWVTPSYGTNGPTPGRWFGGGGGAGNNQPYNLNGIGGAGGGGDGGKYNPTTGTSSAGMNGNVFTGGGGGGRSGTANPVSSPIAGTGGSGIVIIRYPYI